MILSGLVMCVGGCIECTNIIYYIFTKDKYKVEFNIVNKDSRIDKLNISEALLERNVSHLKKS